MHAHLLFFYIALQTKEEGSLGDRMSRVQPTPTWFFFLKPLTWLMKISAIPQYLAALSSQAFLLSMSSHSALTFLLCSPFLSQCCSPCTDWTLCWCVCACSQSCVMTGRALRQLAWPGSLHCQTDVKDCSTGTFRKWSSCEEKNKKKSPFSVIINLMLSQWLWNKFWSC